MIPCLDIHTHHPAPQPQAVIAVEPEEFIPIDDQRYSVGYHPWTLLQPPSSSQWLQFEEEASSPNVVAIGEAGIDKIKGAPMFLQLMVFRKQIEISEKLQKPLIIHDVKAHDVITGLKRDMNPTQKWAIHGFRAKPTVAKMFTDLGCYISFGEFFNPESLLSVPQELILAETDESLLTIEEIIAKISETLQFDATDLIAQNTLRFLSE